MSDDEEDAQSSDFDPDDSIAKALWRLSKKPSNDTHFREPDKLVFRTQPDAPNLRLWWVNTRGVIQNASANPKIREWILECATVTKRQHLKKNGRIPNYRQ